MLILQRAQIRNEAVTACEPGARHALTTVLGYILGVLLAAFYVAPALGLLALALYFLS